MTSLNFGNHISEMVQDRHIVAYEH